MVGWFTPSRRFTLFWAALIIGAIVGSHAVVPLETLLWLAAIWLAITVSGQDPAIEVFSLVIAAGLLGGALWQFSGGEVWMRLSWLGGATNQLTAWRDQLIDKVFLVLPEPHGSLLAGMLLGNRIKLDQSLVMMFRTVGLSHLIAASGQNLSVLTANVSSIFKPILGRRSYFVALLIIVIYIILTGAPASILRAGLMMAVVLSGEYLGRPSRSLNGLILAGGVLVVFEPKIIFDIGFQLSVAATYGIIRVAPLIQDKLSKRWPNWLTSVISQSLAATLMTTPLIVTTFERLSVVSPVMNLIVVPFVPLLMGIGLPAILLLEVWPMIGRLLAWLSWPLLEGTLRLSQYAASWRFASTDLAVPTGVAAVIMIALVSFGELQTHRTYLASKRIRQ